jgi:CheY-like chemotaxis protein/pSer/pThr/pTyr-binding forkhead associated (FHA) protein
MAKAQILVVEDDVVVVMELRDRLQSLGYAVPAVASSGKEAIEKATWTRPDLVLMDIKLKGEIDGVEAAEEICARFNIPVIYLTAYADERTLQRAKVTEPYGYIIKPFDERKLRIAIEIALHKHKMETLRSASDKAEPMYICRQCPEATRGRCIAQSHTSPSSREMIRRAFEARTDTEEMWRILQVSCLRLQEEQEAKTYRESALARRLRLARSDEEAEQLELEEATTTDPRPVLVSATIEPVKTIRSETQELDRVDVKLPPQPVAEKVPERRKEPERELYSLVFEPTKRRIALPTDGEIVLGRPNPQTDFSPDIDLTQEDQGQLSISRRHAKIYGDGNVHYIEDIGSTNGTRVNAQMLQLGQKHRLRQGDRILLGHCLFVYSPTPRWLIHPPPHIKAQFYLLVTPSGQRIDLPDRGELVVGRSDPTLGFVPDIDLRDEGKVSERVARRHVKILCRGRTHSLEDLGSPRGTKINGVPVLLGQLVQLTPGDHIWLGGCVLAYEVEVKGL